MCSQRWIVLFTKTKHIKHHENFEKNLSRAQTPPHYETTPDSRIHLSCGDSCISHYPVFSVIFSRHAHIGVGSILEGVIVSYVQGWVVLQI